MDTEKQGSDHENETNVKQSEEDGLKIEQQAAVVENQPETQQASQCEERWVTALKRSQRIQMKILQKRENELKSEILRFTAVKNQLTNVDVSQSDGGWRSTPKRSARIQLRKLWNKEEEYSIQKDRVVALESQISEPKESVNLRDDGQSAVPTTSNQLQSLSSEKEKSDIRKQIFIAIEIPLESKRLSLREKARQDADLTTKARTQQRRLKDRKDKLAIKSPRATTPESKKALPKRRRTTSQRRQSIDSDLDCFDDFIKYLENIPNKVIPEFDPLKNKPTMKQWLRKVDKCAQQNGWTEAQVIKYALPKLTAHAEIWLQDLKPRQRTWKEWKVLLEETFPTNYAEMFNKMLKIMTPGKAFETPVDNKNFVNELKPLE